MLENLQQVFIELTIRTEQKQCASEGIAWSRIHFYDNVFVCMLFMLETGGSALLTVFYPQIYRHDL